MENQVPPAETAPAAPLALPPCGDADAYRVGYRRPPLHSRWKPGQSGNPSGRPRQAAPRPGQVAALVEQCLLQRVDLPPGPSGRRRRARLAPLVVRKMAEAVDAGDVRAMVELMKSLRALGLSGA